MNTGKLVGQGHEYPLDGNLITIGRAEDNTIVLDDESISGIHAEIIQDNGAYVLRDRGSTNGTFVNGVQIFESTLAPGDSLTLGNVSLEFAVDQGFLTKVHHDSPGGKHESGRSRSRSNRLLYAAGFVLVLTIYTYWHTHTKGKNSVAIADKDAQESDLNVVTSSAQAHSVTPKDISVLGADLATLKSQYPDLDVQAVYNSLQNSDGGYISTSQTMLRIEFQDKEIASIVYPLTEPPTSAQINEFLKRHRESASWVEKSSVESLSEPHDANYQLIRTYTRSDGRLILDYWTGSSGLIKHEIWVRTAAFDASAGAETRSIHRNSIAYPVNPGDFSGSRQANRPLLSHFDPLKASFPHVCKDEVANDDKPWQYYYAKAKDGTKIQFGMNGNDLHFVFITLPIPLATEQISDYLKDSPYGSNWRIHEAPLKMLGYFWISGDCNSTCNAFDSGGITFIHIYSGPYAKWLMAKRN
jgi:hypothetical protein